MMSEEMKLKRATYHLWTFVTSKLISTFGAQVYAFAISFYILQVTGSATNFAMNMVCNILPRSIMAPFAGYVADNYSRKKIVIIAQLITSLAIGGLLLISLTYGLSLTAIYITTAVLSLTSTFSGVGFSSSITGLVDEKRIQKAMSLNQMSISFAAIGSPAIGGVLYGTVSMPTFLIIFMTASIIAVALESTMDFNLFAKRKAAINGEVKQKEPILKSMKEGISYLRLQSVLMIILFVSLAINFLLAGYNVGYAFILIEKLGVESQHFGFTEAAMAIGMLLISIYFSIRKEVKYPLLVSKYGIIILALLNGAATLPLFLDLPYIGIIGYYITLMFVLGCVVMTINTPIGVMMQKTIDDDYKGRVFSVLETMATALMPLGTVLYGFLYDFLPAQWVLVASSIVLLGTILTLARPSVIRKAHPELAKKEKRLKSKIETA